MESEENPSRAPQLFRVNPDGVSHAMAEFRGLAGASFAILVGLMVQDKRDEFLNLAVLCIAIAIPCFIACFLMVRDLDDKEYNSDASDALINRLRIIAYWLVVVSLGSVFYHISWFMATVFGIVVVVGLKTVIAHREKVQEAQDAANKLRENERPQIPPSYQRKK